MKRLVAVSHRVLLPGTPASAGGLARSVRAALLVHGGLWFGWDGSVSTASAASARARRAAGVDYLTVSLSPRQHADAYLGFSNDVLWPTLHGLPPPPADVPLATRYSAYRALSAAWATTLHPKLRADDCVWIHDYQLLPLAGALRQRGHRGPIGFFLHVPFPGLPQWRSLPMHAELLRDLLYCDLLGFQTAGDMEAFRQVAVAGSDDVRDSGGAGVLAGDRFIGTGVYPVGVDIDALRRTVGAGGPEFGPIREWLAGRTLVAGVDRLDYTKGLPARIVAWDHWLRRHAGAAARTGLVQVMPPSRIALPAYANNSHAIAQAVDRCNARHRRGTLDPILLQRALPHAGVLQLLAAAKVACVTPLRDGMNLVAQEFVAVQPPAEPGVLVLGRGAGAAQALTAALLVDATDPAAISAAMARALLMPRAERQRRMAALQSALRRQSLASWHERFVDDLRSCATTAGRGQRNSTPPSPPVRMVPTGT
ncbi:MAG: trehalose-6-phosphate synthase [Steroidobacteraceae bacterium]